MSQRIEEIFSKYKKVFKGREEEIKEFLLKHFEEAFLTKPVINMERNDATDRLKLSGFSSNLSSWRNFYRNIVVSSCVEENGDQKRYDYKFYFTKEKVDEATIEIIQNALDESSRLRRNFQFDEALDKIDEMIELARKKKDEALENILNENRLEVVAEKQKYDKAMEQIAKLEKKIKLNQEYDNLKAVISDCDKLTKIAYSIKRSDLARKYTGILEDTKKELEAREAQEKEKSLEEKKALEEKRVKEKYDKAMAQIAELENQVAINRENDDLKSVIIDCEKIIEIANLIDRSDIAKKYAGILEKTEKELEAKKAQEKAKALEEKKALKEQKAKEKARALEEKRALKEQKAKEKAKALEEKRALKEQKAKEKAKMLEEKEALREPQILEQIAQLENQVVINRENDNLQAVVRDCEQIIKLANSINRNDIAEKYLGILEETKKEFEARKAQEKAKTLEKKTALKEQKAKEKAKALEEKRALKEQKAKEKAKMLEEKEALREPQILEQIAQLENQVVINRENDNLQAVVRDCEQIIKLANSIKRDDIAEKYAGILEETKKELEARKAQEKAKTLEEKKALKEQKAQEKARALEKKRALKEQKALEKMETKEKKTALKKKTDPREKLRKILRLLIIPRLIETLKAERKKKSLIDKEAFKEKKGKVKYDRILEQIAQLENQVAMNRENDNLNAVMSDCKQIIKLANSINRNDIAEKYAGILEDAKKELETRKMQEKGKALEEKKALKVQKAQEKAKMSGEKVVSKEQQVLEQIAQLENQVAMNRESDNLRAVVKDCGKIIKLARSIGRGDIAEKYSGILNETKNLLEERKEQEKTKGLEEKGALKEQKALAKAKTLEKNRVLKKQRTKEKAKTVEEKKVIKEQKAKEKEKLLEEKRALKEQYTLEQIAQLENQIAINRKNDNLKAVVNDCGRIIKLANSIGNDDIADKYSGILEETKKKLEARKTQEKARALEEKRAHKEAKVVEKKVKVKAIASLIIIGGILIILSSILNIILLFTMIYTNISVTIGMETADTFFIFLYVNGCICVLGGILVIFGSKEHISENHRFGKSLTGFGVVLALIGSSMFLIVGLWAALLCGNQTTSITILILIFFGICLVGIMLSIVSQKKMEGKKEEIIKSKYPKGDKLLEKKTLTPQEQYH